MGLEYFALVLLTILVLSIVVAVCKQGVEMKQRPSKQERMMDLALTILTVIVFAIAIYYEVQYFH